VPLPGVRFLPVVVLPVPCFRTSPALGRGPRAVLLLTCPRFYKKLLKLSAGAACLSKGGSNSLLRSMKADAKEHRAREKVQVLIRLRRFAERSKWKKARLSRELGVSVSTVERWLDGQNNIFLASVLAIRRFLEEREFRVEAREDISNRPSPFVARRIRAD
jgi:hypothetical protein